MGNTTLNKLIEDFSHLKLDDKEYAVEIIYRNCNA